jgi:transcription-repair coupling factor (superfamily II helicase)
MAEANLPANRHGQLEKVLITSITPYFLEKGNVWFEENLKKILEAAKTQQFFQDNTLLLEKDQQYSVSQLLRKLDEFGYEKVLTVESLGEFSSRGGDVELFSVAMNHAVRIEFVGNRVDNIEQLEISIEDEQQAKELLKKRLKSQKLFSDIKNLKEGEYLVHLDHGVAKFTGITALQTEHVFSLSSTQYYTLEYAQNDILFIPVGLERKLSRYVGFTNPKVSRLGSVIWQKTKRKAKEEIEKLARELLEIYASREVATRPSYIAAGEIEQKLKETFPYQETPDQVQALEDIYEDLSQTEPMDRIVCGDVGFGKTEVALRAMVRAAHNGYQTVLLAPTTILAHQHYKNFQKRLKDLPIQIAMLSRLQTKKEQQETLQKLKEGYIDIVVGTHRLLSNDVEFKNLGLLVLDDEQRFGVKQKEKFKEMRSSLDVLSLSATPIPRTLYMTLSSLKKISTIQTPPEGRLPIQTTVTTRNEKIVKEAIQKELARNGQVYYLHNRVGTIERTKKYLEKLMPAVSFGVAHGRMKEDQLVKVIEGFRSKKFDVLLATTIIENGLDMANVNTIIIEDATKLGLSQAYQIKGRVGRSNIQSYAYFLYGGKLSDKAKLRLKALKEAEELGSGYTIAMRDLEIRGAGNILGKDQAGTVNTVGLNLYCQMLSESVEKLKTMVQ